MRRPVQADFARVGTPASQAKMGDPHPDQASIPRETALQRRATRAIDCMVLAASPRMTSLLCLIFILSGAAALIYESIWTRYLGLFVGHDAYAQIVVLVIFLGGMSLGSYIVGRRSSALRTPLLWYAGVEFLVGILALVFHDAFVAVTAKAYESLF